MADSSGFVSYKSTKTVYAETVYQFIHGSLYGAIWGLVTPFPAPGSEASKVANTAAFRGEIFRAVPLFGAPLANMPSNAIFFGTILAVQRFTSKSVELIRRREDIYNDLTGFAALYPYYHYVLNHSERRLVAHNRMVGGAVVLALCYANFLA
mmetsp:Transcript_19828/g.25530  ORF Transcript_19828/g.25530 Transcript_19828/m.25530 type:complete len:152 (+) Transcript_19828:179-634(+)|eukprot:CAMPEP_0198143050 /NCGR_PEP_ID=MMETSP1443-20131203/5671_1 /TAXON_ID=186043 /ORGANISM="Entomoneis sp., Strain CCMP2396" /LENGTH=151 /DNA_ID=CAMNT_0043806187 /DNA_START=123 /DNA_END=578 /DNA_ORIENTATION=-